MSHNLDFTSAFLRMDQLFLLINNSIVMYNGMHHDPFPVSRGEFH